MGLGNPGPRYEITRHNAGFLVLDNLAEKYGIDLTKRKYSSVYGYGEINGQQTMVVKPLTYMNHSGKAARSILQALNILPEYLIVIHDDIDLPLGKIKFKKQGGDGGQLGIRSISECIGTDAYNRIRVGVGRPKRKDDIVDYVLSPFEEDERDTLNEVIEQALRMVEMTLVELNKRTNLTEEQKGC
ncbi:uncharacterized protein METZ01_LOCUS231643 [marine metagenome]|uniref:peptidyl-tRNA hydrolase n=1 Tax=marine metagenome TaxID=408172 RepID=A0A382GV06_9ZZZZ